MYATPSVVRCHRWRGVLNPVRKRGNRALVDSTSDPAGKHGELAIVRWSAKSMKPPRISFYGNFGTGNLGNECTLQAVVERVLRRWPDAQLLCFCSIPQDVRTRHNIA